MRLERPGRSPLTIPMHSELDRGTLRSIIKAAGLTVEEFSTLVPPQIGVHSLGRLGRPKRCAHSSGPVKLRAATGNPNLVGPSNAL